MKKIFAILSVAASLVACNNAGTSTTTTDSIGVKVDSNVTKVDTIKIGTDTSKMLADTATMKMKADSSKR